MSDGKRTSIVHDGKTRAVKIREAVEEAKLHLGAYLDHQGQLEASYRIFSEWVQFFRLYNCRFYTNFPLIIFTREETLKRVVRPSHALFIAAECNPDYLEKVAEKLSGEMERPVFTANGLPHEQRLCAFIGVISDSGGGMCHVDNFRWGVANDQLVIKHDNSSPNYWGFMCPDLYGDFSVSGKEAPDATRFA